MKKCIYTIKFGNYDPMREHYMTPGWDHILITDNDIAPPGWIVKKVNTPLPVFLAARYCYINSHRFVSEYDYSIMIGGQIRINADLDKFIENYIDLSIDINLMKHPCRTCIYKEAQIVMDVNLDTKENVIPHMEKYREDGFPENFGLSACGIICRRSNDVVAKHNDLWWNEVLNGSYRDQLSFDYVRWKYAPCTYKHFGEYLKVLHSGFFELYTHSGKML